MYSVVDVSGDGTVSWPEFAWFIFALKRYHLEATGKLKVESEDATPIDGGADGAGVVDVEDVKTQDAPEACEAEDAAEDRATEHDAAEDCKTEGASETYDTKGAPEADKTEGAHEDCKTDEAPSDGADDKLLVCFADWAHVAELTSGLEPLGIDAGMVIQKLATRSDRDRQQARAALEQLASLGRGGHGLPPISEVQEPEQCEIDSLCVDDTSCLGAAGAPRAPWPAAFLAVN